MSRAIETRIKIGVESAGAESAQSALAGTRREAKEAQAAFSETEAASEALYSSIIDAAPEAKASLDALSESFTRLKTEMSGLGSGVQQTIQSILQRLEQADLTGVADLTSSKTYANAPESVQATVAQMVMQTHTLGRQGIPVDFAQMQPQAAPEPTQAEPVGIYNGSRYNRLRTRFEGRLDTFETSLDGAETDVDTLTPHATRELRRRLGQIGSIGRQVRSASAGRKDEEVGALEERLGSYSSRLDDLLQQRAERGHRDEVEPEAPEYQRNFERLFEKRLTAIGRDVPTGDPAALERRVTRAAGDLAYHQPNLDDDTFARFSEELTKHTDALSQITGPWRQENTRAFEGGFRGRMERLDTDLTDLDPYSAGRGALLGHRKRLEGMQDDLTRAGDGLEPEVFDELNGRLKDLADSLDANVRAYNESERGAPIDPAQTPQQGQGPLEGLFEQVMSRIPTGGALGRALPPVAAAAGAVGVANLADKWLTGQNRAAREEHSDMTDLAKGLGIWTKPWEMFRSSQTGMSDDDLVDLGYTGTDAGRVASQMDRPGRAFEVRADTEDVLRFARSTGLDEGRVADAVRNLGRAGSYQPGGAEGPLETLKMALTEAVKNGVSQADTMNALVDLSQRAIAEGRTLPPEALAFNAALLTKLGDTGNAALQGSAGAQAAQNLNSFATGQGNVPMQMALAPVVRDATAADLGLEGEAAEGYENLKQYDSLAASRMALNVLSDGRNPELSTQLMGRLEQLAGDNPTMMQQLLEQAGFSPEQQAAFLGGDMSALVGEAADATPEYLKGQGLDTGPQTNNQLARDSERLGAIDRDAPVANSWGNYALNNGGDLELKEGRRTTDKFTNRAKTAVGAGDDVGPRNLRGMTEEELRDERLKTRRWQDDQELREDYERANGAPAPMSGVDGALTRFNDATSPQKFLEWFRGLGRQERPTPADDGAAAPYGFDEALKTLGATAVTMEPGEPYSGLAGTPAAHLEGQPHRGIDLRIGRQGQPDPIRSPWASAEIYDAGYSESYGNWLAVEAENGSKFQLGHLDGDMTDRVGDRVGRGDYLATEGSSGKSTGHHLDMRALDDEGGVMGLNTDGHAFRQYLEESLRGVVSAPPREQVVTVRHEGLDRISVAGDVSSAQKRRLEALYADATREIFTPYQPESHHGNG